MVSAYVAAPELIEFIRHLGPARVLDVEGTLAARLRSPSLAVETDEAAAAPCDLVICLDPNGQHHRVRKWAALSSAILIALPLENPAGWMEAFLEEGYFPDLSYRGPGALLRRTGSPSPAQVAALAAEVLRLRASEGRTAALEHRIRFLHSMVEDLRRQTASVVESRTWRLLTGAGKPLLRRLRRKLAPPQGCHDAPPPERYHRWIAEYERRDLSPVRTGPLFSVVAPGERALASLRAQSYGCWEAVATLEEARGDFVCFPGPEDEFSPDALAAFAEAAECADLVYSDEDALEGAGVRTAPLFKPGWSPYLLASENYLGRAMVLRRRLVDAGAAPYELALRAAAAGIHAAHIPRVLYHRRGPREFAAREVIERSLAGVRVEEGLAPGCWRVRYPLGSAVPVEVLVPSRNSELLDRCLGGLRAQTRYESFRITVIDNSDRGLDDVAARHGARCVDWRKRRFNYSLMNNEAALASTAPLLLFLNDDTAVTDPGWMEAMAELAMRPDVGAVGARLLYPGGAIQHAGVAIGIYGVCGHAFRECPAEKPSYLNLAHVIREVSAVTGACLMLRAEVFREAGGFDAASFPVAYNDIDLCLRILERGRSILYTPHATLHHHEARSKPRRLRAPARAEVRAFQARWRKYIAHDPYYSPNLTRAAENFALRSRAWED